MPLPPPPEYDLLPHGHEPSSEKLALPAEEHSRPPREEDPSLPPDKGWLPPEKDPSLPVAEEDPPPDKGWLPPEKDPSLPVAEEEPPPDKGGLPPEKDPSLPVAEEDPPPSSDGASDGADPAPGSGGGHVEYVWNEWDDWWYSSGGEVTTPSTPQITTDSIDRSGSTTGNLTSYDDWVKTNWWITTTTSTTTTDEQPQEQPQNTSQQPSLDSQPPILGPNVSYFDCEAGAGGMYIFNWYGYDHIVIAPGLGTLAPPEFGGPSGLP